MKKKLFSNQLFLESSEGIRPPNSKATKGDGPPTLTPGRKEVKSLLASELKVKVKENISGDRKKKRRGMRQRME